MKIGLMSDVHLEFDGINVKNVDGIEVLLLAGDICVASAYGNENSQHYKKFDEFFANCSEQFPIVLYVMGNHEHYHGRFDNTLDIMKRGLSKYPNIYVLENETWTHNDGTIFFGATLWTDMNRRDPITMYACGQAMNDYRTVKIHDRATDVYRRLSPDDTVVAHEHTINSLRSVLSECDFEDRVVVVGHHAPCKASTKPGYEDDNLINGAYSSDITNLILGNPNIKLWVHGHTHHEFDYMVGSTRIVTNPRGYVGFERGTQSEQPYTYKVLEI